MELSHWSFHVFVSHWREGNGPLVARIADGIVCCWTRRGRTQRHTFFFSLSFVWVAPGSSSHIVSPCPAPLFSPHKTQFYPTNRPHPNAIQTMSELRHRITLTLILFLSFVAFASYHKGTGSTAWLQWLTLIVFLTMGYVFDVSFTDSNMFVFDPDADNWRRKTEAARN